MTPAEQAINEIEYARAVCMTEALFDIDDALALVAELRQLRAQAQPCTWTEDAAGTWATACGDAWILETTEDPARSAYKFCPACGHPIQFAPYTEPEPDATA